MQVEKLIKELPSVPADWLNGDVNLIEKNSISNGTPLQHVENGMNLRETQSMLLERIASEMNRLKFYNVHAQVSFALFTFNHWWLPFYYIFVKACQRICSTHLD